MQYLETLLGAQGMIYGKWAAAFAAVLILAVILLKLLRSLMGTSLNVSDRTAARGRVPRLGVTEYFNLDKQGRRLVIVRRDNIEHLVLIGGPNDLLVESNIVRADRSGAPRIEARETTSVFGKTEPEAQVRPEPVARREPTIVPTESRPAPINDRQPVVDIPREDLAQRLEEVLRKPVTPREPEQAPPPIQKTVQAPSRLPVPEPARPAPPAILPPRPVNTMQPEIRPRQATVIPAKDPVPPPAPTPAPPVAPAVDQKRPAVLDDIFKPRDRPPALAEPEPPKPSEFKSVEPLRPPAPPVVSVPPPPLEDVSAAAKNPFDSLEEEMARLLGRGLGDKK